jgi:CubicO group peptidase (beta-lactamase class C family)
MSYCSAGYNLAGEIVRQVSGQSLESFAHERIFDPLGMKDTAYSQPDETQSRVVRRRPLDPPPFGLDDPEYHRQPWPEAGVMSTALDMAVFGQMFLNGGVYGGERILSPATVREMTRNQLPGISARFGTEFFPEAGWGYGWGIEIGKRERRGPTLVSPQTFSHGGSGGVFLWIDPVAEIVGVYFSVARQAAPFQSLWYIDHFADMVTAAVL